MSEGLIYDIIKCEEVKDKSKHAALLIREQNRLQKLKSKLADNMKLIDERRELQAQKLDTKLAPTVRVRLRADTDVLTFRNKSHPRPLTAWEKIVSQ